jgi:hypothetical protein
MPDNFVFKPIRSKIFIAPDSYMMNRPVIKMDYQIAMIGKNPPESF